MESDQTLPGNVQNQVIALGARVAAIRKQLDQGKFRPEREVLSQLAGLENTLSQLGNQLKGIEKEHSNLTALAEIGQVVNSSLELDEVLRIVMDNIIRLTQAERGFLMLRDETGEMVTRIARNWEQESLNAS